MQEKYLEKPDKCFSEITAPKFMAALFGRTVWTPVYKSAPVTFHHLQPRSLTFPSRVFIRTERSDSTAEKLPRRAPTKRAEFLSARIVQPLKRLSTSARSRRRPRRQIVRPERTTTTAGPLSGERSAPGKTNSEREIARDFLAVTTNPVRETANYYHHIRLFR